jgi:hypothetical protein
VAIWRFGERSPDAQAIALAAAAMNAAADRASAAEGMAPMTDPELAAIAKGIDAAKAAIPYLDVRSLAQQHRAVTRRMATERGRDAT